MSATDTLPPAGDRRSSPELRPIFEQAYDIIRPFFDERTSWSSGHGHEALAFRTLRDRFPELSQQQLFVIVTAAQRVFRTGGKIAAP